jgi:UDP-N-acetylglucosamine--N-acetylmuramyl-(pentapeptide) pyrophosphoryl-undecaprenol N-acetylglucosamine transferase
MNADRGHIILASGGTGGHVFPARAVAQELLTRGYKVTLMTDRRGEKYEAMFPGVDIVEVQSGSPSIGGLLGKIKATVKLGFGTLQSALFLRKTRPLAVIGFGGYPSMPPSFAASLCKIPLVLHEQNAVLGRVNRLLAGQASKIAVSFPNTETAEIQIQNKMTFTGNPVRQEILALHCEGRAPLDDAGKIELLILGGSQGATILSDVVPGAVALLHDELQQRLHITQQCRKEDLDRVDAVYEETQATNTLSAFFDNMPELLSKAHLVIARSGASTMAEIAAVGRAAIYVPYKFAMDNHQYKNACTSVERGAAELIHQDDFTVEILSQKLSELLLDPEKISVMAKGASHCAEVSAAQKMADIVEQIAKKTENGTSVAGKVVV